MLTVLQRSPKMVGLPSSPSDGEYYNLGNTDHPSPGKMDANGVTALTSPVTARVPATNLDHIRTTLTKEFNEHLQLQPDDLKTLLHEERAENDKLRLENKRLQSVIAQKSQREGTLPNEHSNGTPHPPGQSATLLDNLSISNVRLKQENQQLAKRCSLYERQLHNQSNSQQPHPPPPLSALDEKDAEIQQLQKRLIEMEEAMITQDCGNVPELKQKLQETAVMCQHLATELDTQRAHLNQSHDVTNPGKTHPKTFHKRGDSGFSDDSDDLRQENTRLMEKTSKLDIKLKEVIEINARWQVYNQQREEYIEALQRRLEQRMSPTSAEQHAQIDNLLLQWKQKYQCLEEEKQKLEDECMLAKADKARLEQSTKEQEEIIQALQLQPEHASTHGRPLQQDDQEQLSMLQQQVQVYAQDFDHERRDRERAQTKLQEIEHELRVTKETLQAREHELVLNRRQLEQFQSAHLGNLYNRRQEALSKYQNEYNSNMGKVGLVARGPIFETDGPDEDDGEDEIDGPMFAPSGSPAEAAKKQDMLECPRCKKGFTVDNHSDLLEHIDKCCD